MIAFEKNKSTLEGDDEEEEGEEILNEEAQLMVSMGLPLAFVSSSDKKREVSYFFLY